MKAKNQILILLISIVLSRNAYSQVTKDDAASWGLKILSSELDRKGKYGYADAILGLSKLFEVSSERKYQKDLSRIMSTLNFTDGVYAIRGGNIAPIPDGYVKQDDGWYSLNDIKDGELVLVVGGKLYSIDDSYLLFYNNEWKYFDKSKIEDLQPFMIENNDLKKINDGWYRENNTWKHISQLNLKPVDNYSYSSAEPYGLYVYSSWTDVNSNGIKEKQEFSGLNKPLYNIEKERLNVELNIPVISDQVVFMVWKGDLLIGTSVRNLKEKGSNYFNYIGPGGDPAVSMDFMDRIEFDVRKNGPGFYRIIATNSDKEFEYFEVKVKVISEP